MPPIWYSVARALVGTIAVFAMLIAQNRLCLPSKKDLPFVASMGILMMGVVIILINFGLNFVDPGRSAILLYTTPLWVAPIARFFFKESMSPTTFLGLILGFCGIIILFNPTSFDWHDRNTIIGNGCLILSALLWAGVHLHTRYGKWEGKPIDLLPWQMLAGTIFTIICAIIFERHPQITWNFPLTSTILFNGILTSAFGFFSLMAITRKLPSITSSLGLLGVPIFGFLFSAILLHEPITQNLIISGTLIILGLVTITLSPSLTKNQEPEAT